MLTPGFPAPLSFVWSLYAGLCWLYGYNARRHLTRRDDTGGSTLGSGEIAVTGSFAPVFFILFTVPASRRDVLYMHPQEVGVHMSRTFVHWHPPIRAGRLSGPKKQRRRWRRRAPCVGRLFCNLWPGHCVMQLVRRDIGRQQTGRRRPTVIEAQHLEQRHVFAYVSAASRRVVQPTASRCHVSL